jgi:hypothetical protein
MREELNELLISYFQELMSEEPEAPIDNNENDDENEKEEAGPAEETNVTFSTTVYE